MPSSPLAPTPEPRAEQAKAAERKLRELATLCTAELWTLEQLLAWLPRSRSTVYRWIADEGFPVVRVDDNSEPLFLQSSVLEWLREREVRSESRTASARALEAARQQTRRRRSRRSAPPPIAGAGSRERLRRIRGAH
jgi:predicted DNA-binding transcriptional regulator AlpA